MPNPTTAAELRDLLDEIIGSAACLDTSTDAKADGAALERMAKEFMVAIDAYARQQVRAALEEHGLAIEIETEFRRALTLYPRPQSSPHEGYAVILEELDELWEEVKASKPNTDRAAMRTEAIQVASMALRFVKEVCDDVAAIAALRGGTT